MYSLIFLLLFMDILILTVWTIKDPLRKYIVQLPEMPSDDDKVEIIYKPQLEICKCQFMTTWIGNIL